MKPKSRTVAVFLVAAVVGIVVAAMLPPALLYPPVCSSAGNVGEFCVSYDPEAKRYEDPPRGVPADFSLGVTETANPEFIRTAAGVGTFALVTLFGIVATRRRKRRF